MSLSSAASSASSSAFASASVASSGFLRLSTPSSASLLTLPRLRLEARLPFGLIASSGRAFSCRASPVGSLRTITLSPPSSLSAPLRTNQAHQFSRLRRYNSQQSGSRHFHVSAAARMGVHNLGDKSDYQKAVEASKSQLMVLDCYATWCGPCKVIAPKIVEFSEEFTKAAFYKLDVDDVPEVAQELGIRAMPTFLIFKDGQKVGEVVGANPAALKTAIKGHYGE